MNKMIKSIFIVSVVAAVAIAASTAFFSDTETSTDNVFEAGAIDLRVDNTSYWNRGEGGVIEAVAGNTWGLRDLDDELFFSFYDLKPGDLGEDTVSLHLTSNPAWVCVDIDITENSDVDCTEPEEVDDTDCMNPDEGDLAGQLNFVFWVDDGDNVLEEGEEGRIITQGPASDVLDGVTWALADSEMNVFTGQAADPLEPNTEESLYYIGKAWCFGELTVTPVSEGDENPVERQVTGVSCNGEPVNNAAQTDSLMGDISFRAVQSRHNAGFLCSAREATTETGTGWSPVDLVTGKEWFAKTRMNNTANYELNLGINDGDSTTFDQDEAAWSQGTVESFSLSYDGTNATLNFPSQNSVTWAVPVDSSSRVGITLKAHSTGTTTVDNLMLDLASLPDDSVSVSNGTAYLMISGVDLSGGFVLSGDLTFSWTTPPPDNQGGAESQKMQISVD